MDVTAIQSSDKRIPSSMDRLKKTGKRRWTCDEDPETDSESISDSEISIKSTKSFEAQNIEHVIENGRRYCNETYFMPNDEAEQTRLNVLHQMALILLDGNLTSVPLAKATPRILDIGTGPGDWAIEMSSMYPGATIIASDIGVFDNGLSDVDLPNVSFQLDDAQDEWTYHEPFDLIHLRGLSGAFPDWRPIYQQAFRHLTPGGYIEIIDADPAADTVTFPKTGISYLETFLSAIRSAGEGAGFPRDQGHLAPSALNAAGFADVRVVERLIPIGLWPEDPREKTLGKMALIALLEGLEAFSMRQLTATGGWTADGVRDLCDKVKGELLSTANMTCMVKVVTARKPYLRAHLRERRGNDVLQRLMKNLDE